MRPDPRPQRRERVIDPAGKLHVVAEHRSAV
jgi:hypothetical protein